MKFILTRHGEKQFVEGIKYIDYFNASLSKAGIIEIKKLANFLKSNYPSLIGQKFVYCSHIPRSIQSAEILRNILNIQEISVHQNLQEYYGTQDYTLTRDERRKLHLKTYVNKDYVPSDVGRSMNQAISDLKKQLEFIATGNQNEYSLIAGHGMINRCFIYSLVPELAPSPEKLFDDQSKLGGYSIIEYKDRQFTVLKNNLLPD